MAGWDDYGDGLVLSISTALVDAYSRNWHACVAPGLWRALCLCNGLSFTACSGCLAAAGYGVTNGREAAVSSSTQLEVNCCWPNMKV